MIGSGCVPTWTSAGKAAASSDASDVTPPGISVNSKNAVSPQVCQCRKKGGGRKRLIEASPALEENFLKVLHDHTAGDPMRAEVKWTNLSRRQIAEKLGALGTPASRQVVSQLLRKHRYRRRKALKRKTMGPRDPNRNAQFENIARLKKKYLKAGLPVLSMDTKKKESLGNFFRE